jgi:hypothetical protein
VKWLGFCGSGFEHEPSAGAKAHHPRSLTRR